MRLIQKAIKFFFPHESNFPQMNPQCFFDIPFAFLYKLILLNSISVLPLISSWSLKEQTDKLLITIHIKTQQSQPFGVFFNSLPEDLSLYVNEVLDYQGLIPLRILTKNNDVVFKTEIKSCRNIDRLLPNSLKKVINGIVKSCQTILKLFRTQPLVCDFVLPNYQMRDEDQETLSNPDTEVSIQDILANILKKIKAGKEGGINFVLVKNEMKLHQNRYISQGNNSIFRVVIDIEPGTLESPSEIQFQPVTKQVLKKEFQYIQESTEAETLSQLLKQIPIDENFRHQNLPEIDLELNKNYELQRGHLYMKQYKVSLKEYIENEKYMKNEVFYPRIALSIQICHILYFLHKIGYIHSDVKVQNFLISGQNHESFYNLKLIDFEGLIKSTQSQNQLSIDEFKFRKKHFLTKGNYHPETRNYRHPKFDLYGLGRVLDKLFKKMKIPENYEGTSYYKHFIELEMIKEECRYPPEKCRLSIEDILIKIFYFLDKEKKKRDFQIEMNKFF